MTRIIGIDPGSIKTGYGIIDVDGGHNVYVDSGCIRIQGDSLPDRLKIIFSSIDELLKTFQPNVMAIEQVFMHRNADSALKLGQARGAAICAGVIHSLPVSEYTPRAVKQSVVGKGGAAKEQVQHMVKTLLALSSTPQEDAADALAIALCHAHTNQGISKMQGVTGKRGGRLR
jgi:crossover junction endodeoxyribonuclease RuvC